MCDITYRIIFCLEEDYFFLSLSTILWLTLETLAIFKVIRNSLIYFINFMLFKQKVQTVLIVKELNCMYKDKERDNDRIMDDRKFLQFKARDALLIRKLLHRDHSSVSWFTNETIRKIRIAIKLWWDYDRGFFFYFFYRNSNWDMFPNS